VTESYLKVNETLYRKQSSFFKYTYHIQFVSVYLLGKQLIYSNKKYGPCLLAWTIRNVIVYTHAYFRHPCYHAIRKWAKENRTPSAHINNYQTDTGQYTCTI
jgi:hypothetical protein